MLCTTSNGMRREFTKAILGAFIALGLLLSLNNYAAAQNGSLYLSPSSGNVSVGQTFSIVLRVNTGGTAINAAEGSVVFDQAKLSVTSVSKSGSVFTIWAEEPKFSNAEGTVSFGGGVPNPGYSGSNGTVITINFRARTATSINGVTDISIVSGGILANDGYGTNILASLGKATYTIAPGVITPVPAPGEPEVSVPTLSKVSIISPTHPDSSKWYSSNNPLFRWDVPSGISEVILVLSRRANSPPIISYSPPISERLLDDLDEGEWYLNARFRTAAGLGPTTSFKFNIDTEPPSAFSVTRLDTKDPTNPRPELLFESSDETSGIDHYELSVNEGEPTNILADEAGQSYTMPLQTPGEKNIEIKAFDRAGNIALARLTIQIESIEVPRLDRVSVKVREGQPLVVEGTAKPNQKVLIYVVHENDKPSARIVNTVYAGHNGDEYKVYEAVADANGRFTLAITNLPAGKYKLYVKAQDERGAVSDPSNEQPIEVRGGFWDFIFRIFDWLIGTLSGGALFIAFLMALVGLILALIKLFEDQIRKWWRIVNKRRKIKGGEKRSTRTLTHIKSDIKKELEILNSISKNRRLTLQEKYLKSRLERDLRDLEGRRLVD